MKDEGVHITDSKYGKHIVSTFQMQADKQQIAAKDAKYATRILWLDENVVPGAFHMNTAGYLKAAAHASDPGGTSFRGRGVQSFIVR